MRQTLLLLNALALLATACGDDADTCYSPTQNLSSAYDEGAEGCSCDPAEDASVCVPDPADRNVALICEAGHWEAVEDGPCMPVP